MSYTLSLATLLSIAGPAFAATHAVNLPSNFHTGVQTGIGSWFQAVSDQDVTNGISWCGYKYTNSDPLISVPLASMGGQTYSTDPTAWKAATQKYCGLEANVTDTTTGRSKLMYIGDGFDMKFVRSPGSLDIMLEGFKEIHGDPKGVKDDVIQNLSWQLTGNRNSQYAAPGTEDPPVDQPKSSEKPSPPYSGPSTPSESSSTPSASSSTPSASPSASPSPSPSTSDSAKQPYQGSSGQNQGTGDASTPAKDEDNKKSDKDSSSESQDASTPSQEEPQQDSEDSCPKPDEETSGDNNKDSQDEKNSSSSSSSSENQDQNEKKGADSYGAYHKRTASSYATNPLQCRGSPRNCASRRA